MKQIVIFILTSVVLLVPNAFCQDECCFEFSGEWLYMLSAIDQPYYAIHQGTGATIVNGERVANNQEWHSGYRLEAAYRFGCCDFARVRWTHFNNFSDSSSDDQLSAGILSIPFAIVNDADFSEIRDNFDFYYLDFLYERNLYSCCPFYLGLEVGIQLAHLDMNENVLYIESGERFVIKNQSKLRGVGPELGLDMRYSLFNCLDIKGRVMSSLLVTKKQAKSKEVRDASLIYSTENQDYWIATPAFDARFGLNYDYALQCGCFCGNFNIEVGYEIIHIMKGVDRIYFPSGNGEGISFTQNMDFTLHGPYVHLGFCF